MNWLLSPCSLLDWPWSLLLCCAAKNFHDQREKYRSKKDPEKGHPNHSSEDGGTQCLVHFGPCALGDHQWQPDRTSDHLKELVANGQRTSEGIYASAREQQERLRHSISDVFTGIDVVLSVPAFGEAPSGLSDTGDAAFCTPWTFLGLPAITLPVGFGPAGLPLGIQLTGANREDFKLARIARWCERVIGYERRWPS
jgi:Asp-tRNA(Asn)/Glu-tRNA(Gln) amidotransferase A subunit family amidase